MQPTLLTSSMQHQERDSLPNPSGIPQSWQAILVTFQRITYRARKKATGSTAETVRIDRKSQRTGCILRAISNKTDS